VHLVAQLRAVKSTIAFDRSCAVEP